MSKVTYKPVLGFDGYRVGSDGSVWTCRRRFYCNGHKGVRYEFSDSWTRMRTTIMRTHYEGVRLYKGDEQIHVLVHRLVLEAFVSLCPPGCEGAHDNGNRSDNRLGNLSWKTRKDNQNDRIRHGTHSIGERNGNAKLSNDQVAEIRAKLKAGRSQVSVACEYGVRPLIVSRVARQVTYPMLVPDRPSQEVATTPVEPDRP